MEFEMFILIPSWWIIRSFINSSIKTNASVNNFLNKSLYKISSIWCREDGNQLWEKRELGAKAWRQMWWYILENNDSKVPKVCAWVCDLAMQEIYTVMVIKWIFESPCVIQTVIKTARLDRWSHHLPTAWMLVHSFSHT